VCVLARGMFWNPSLFIHTIIKIDMHNTVNKIQGRHFKKKWGAVQKDGLLILKKNVIIL
jgi:hypothetical protein